METKHDHVKHKGEYIIPKFDDINETYFPFTRDDHWDVYETFKTIVMIPIAIIRATIAILFIIIGWMICKLAVVGFDGCLLNNITAKIPIWRKVLRKIGRYMACIFLYCVGVHSYKYKRLTYKDLYLQYGYKRPDIDLNHNHPLYNIEPKSYIIASNHLGYLDTLLYLGHYNASFLCIQYVKLLPFVNDIAKAAQSLFIQKGVKVSQQLLSRIQLQHDTHDKYKCKGCYLCSATLVIYPEGTTTNSKRCLLPFRSSLFRSGKPIRICAIKAPYKHFNSCWESIPFCIHLFKILTQVYNHIELIEAPPYIPSKQEIDDPYLYSFNVNRLMCKMLGNQYKIYLLNTNHKKQCYHPYLMKECDKKYALRKGKELFQQDVLIQTYLKLIQLRSSR